MDDYQQLLEKLLRVDALYAGATTAGEQAAAADARERLRAKMNLAEIAEPPIEYKFTFTDPWARRIFLALLRRYELRPYRFRGQRYTTVQTKVSKKFVDETLWPEFLKISKILRDHLDAVTNRVLADVVHGDFSEAEEREAPRQLAG